ncbi:hypothetical protein MMC29_003030 [Sticta canariensis]|nr:hypothetical protein [Sticta canariensis]
MESPITPPELVVSLDEDEAYAGTSHSEWQSMIKQMENLIPLKLEDIESENGDCEICYEPLGLEEPIKLLACGHVFGQICLYRWLAEFMPSGKWWDWKASDAYWPHPSEEVFGVFDENEFHEAIIHTNVRDVSIAYREDGRLRRDWRDYLNWSSDNNEDLMPTLGLWPSNDVHHATCPKCRNEFSILRYGEVGMRIEARLRFWDLMYEKLGLSRSAKEEQSRNDILRYIKMVQVPRTEIKLEHMRQFTLQAQVSAMRFALRRGNRELDPLQSDLRDAIFNLACYGLHDGEYCAISYENRRIPLWCYQVDRIERGLSPAVLGVMQWSYGVGKRPSTDIGRYSEKFFLELQQQVSGPWRRTLFAEVGGDRDGLRWDGPWGFDSEELQDDMDILVHETWYGLSSDPE